MEVDHSPKIISQARPVPDDLGIPIVLSSSLNLIARPVQQPYISIYLSVSPAAMASQTPQAETESPAETAPLLGPDRGVAISGSSNKVASQGTFAGSSSDAGIGAAADVENGSLHAETATDGFPSSTDLAKPNAKMVALFPALAIGVRARDTSCHGFHHISRRAGC